MELKKESPHRAISEEFLEEVIDRYQDADVVRRVLSGSYGDQTLSMALLEKMMDECPDEDLLREMLPHYRGQVTEEFLIRVAEEFWDEDLLMEILRSHFKGGRVSVRFLEAILDGCPDEDLFHYVLKHHFTGKLPQELIRRTDDEFMDSDLLLFMLAEFL